MQDSGLTEDRVIEALTECKGDLIQTYMLLGIRLGVLNNFMRNVPRLRRLYQEMSRLREEEPDEYDRLTAEEFRRAMESRTALYQFEGLEVIHDLATMQHTNASEAEVRLKAAKELRGAVGAQNGSLVALMQEMNEAYQSMAPRVKALRAQATLTISMESPEPCESTPRSLSAP